jgi:hypothetical protein
MLGVTSSILQAFGSQNAQNTQSTLSAQNNFQQLQSEFQQLGQDLQSGNLAQAQQDYATLSKNIPSAQQSANSPITQDMGTLAKALQSGNLTSAQQAYTTLQQDVQEAFNHVRHHHGHDHSAQDTQSSPTSQNNNLLQLFNQLGSALQSGTLSAAQQAYSTIQQDLTQFASTGSFGSAGASASAGSGGLNVTV